MLAVCCQATQCSMRPLCSNFIRTVLLLPARTLEGRPSPCPRHVAPQPLRFDGAGCPVLAHEAAHHAGPGAGWDSVGRIVQRQLPSRLPCRPRRHHSSARGAQTTCLSGLRRVVHLLVVHSRQAVDIEKGTVCSGRGCPAH